MFYYEAARPGTLTGLVPALEKALKDADAAVRAHAVAALIGAANDGTAISPAARAAVERATDAADPVVSAKAREALQFLSTQPAGAPTTATGVPTSGPSRGIIDILERPTTEPATSPETH
jgi:hypothetical protein